MVFLIELDPLRAHRKAVDLVTRHPQTVPLVREMVVSHEALLDSLTEDFDALGGAQ